MSRPKQKHKEKELMLAILRNDGSQVVRLAASRPGLDALLIKGAIVSYQRMRQDPRGRNITPLLVAVHFGELELCKYLIQEEVDVNAGFLQGLKPLSLALDNKHYEIAKLLIDSGADVNQQNEDGETAMEYAINEYSPVKIVEDLLAAGVDKNGIINKFNYRPIKQAVTCNNISVVKYLLEQSVDIDVTDRKKSTPLLFAAFVNFIEIAELLIQNGAKVDELGEGYIPPLCIALMNRDGQIVKMLVNAGANIHKVVNPKDYKVCFSRYDGRLSILHLAVENLNLEAVKVLLEKGAKVNSTEEKYGLTPLQFIIHHKDFKKLSNLVFNMRGNYRKIIQMLIENGAELKSTLNGLTVPQLAVALNRWVGLEEIVKTGLDVNAKVKENLSIFHYALINDRFELAGLCLKFGADVFVRFKSSHGNLLPVEYAMRCCSPRLLDMIASHTFAGFDRPLNTNPHRSTLETFIMKDDFALSRAIQTNKILLAKWAFEGGAKVTNGHIFDLKHALHHPIAKKNVELVKLLLQHGVHLQVPYADKSTYLHLAMRFCQFEVVRVLLTHGACYNHKDAKGITPVQVEIKDGTQEKEQIPLGDRPASFMKYVCDIMLEEKLRYIETETRRMQEEESSSSSDETSYFIDESEDNQKNSKTKDRKQNLKEASSMPNCREINCLNIFKKGATQTKETISNKSSQSKKSSQSSKKDFTQEEESKGLLKDVSRMFSMVRRGDAKVLKLLEAKKKKKPEEFLSYINCINRRGNTLMSEAVMLGLGDIAEGIMKLRLEES